MQKYIITSIIDKYYLNGTVESVKWSIKDKNINIDFITPFKNLVGKITSPNFELDDSEIGIYNTSQFSKLVKIMDSTIVLKLIKSEKGTPLELAISDNQYDLNYYLSDLMLIENVPSINEPASYDVEVEVESSFITMFNNAKKALGDVKQFTVKTEYNKAYESYELLITIGDGNSYANKIKFKSICESTFGLEETPFPADIMMEILKANEDANSRHIHISQDGLMKLTFKEGLIESTYYLVRLSNQ
jgi:hypothetical protein